MARMQLNSRERAVVIGGGAVILIMAILLLVQGPYEAYSRSEDQLASARERLKRAQTLRDQYLSVQAGYQELEEQLPETFNQPLLSIINQVLREAELTEGGKAQLENFDSTIVDARDQLDPVRLTLTGVSLEELVDVLYKIYRRSGVLLVEQVNYLRPGSNDQGLNIQLLLSKVRPS